MVRALTAGAVTVFVALGSVMLTSGAQQGGAQQPAGITVSETARVWHPLTLDLQGPLHAETDSNPNPFLDYRLQVIFRGPSGREYNVPGFFDGDGTGGERGNVWRTRFTPDEPGRWQYTVSFRSGVGAAVAEDRRSGTAVRGDGLQGSIQVAARDPNAPGFLKWGRLEYVGGHYLKFRDGGYWIRGGTDEPENFLAYEGFDNTVAGEFGIHRYAAHVSDWRPGDPDWGNGRGRAIIGAINYLASRNTNNLYFLPMNIGGDGKDVWPFAGKPNPQGSPMNDNLHYDLGKLAQWEIVFAHAQRQGLFLHVVLNEAEEANKRELDDAQLGPERKLFYREMVARLGHHLAMQWNLGEEHNNGAVNLKDLIPQFADYILSIDPYAHPITVHPGGNPLETLRFTFGDKRFSMTSIQTGGRELGTLTDEFRRQTAAAGRPLPISMDEYTLGGGLLRCGPPETIDMCRKARLWPVLLSGGMVEIILLDLLEVDNFKEPNLESIWNHTWYARSFVERLPFHEMQPMDWLMEGAGTISLGEGAGTNIVTAQVFAKPGEVYAIYLPKADPTGSLSTYNTTGNFEVSWYNPRSGRFEGQTRMIAGGARAEALGAPPSDPAEDWVVLVRKR